MRQPFLNARLQGFGTTIFAEMSALAVATGAVNLGQGFPDTDGPREVLDAADRRHPQRPATSTRPAPACPSCARPSPSTSSASTASTFDPDTEVLVTAGATEAIAASLLALCETGDEVIAFEPYYDSYAACIAMAGAVRRPITLRPPTFAPDLDAARATPSTRGPGCCCSTRRTTRPGTVLDPRASSPSIARLAVEHDLLVVSDEVYEHLTFDVAHMPDRVAARACASAPSPSARAARRSRSPAGRSAGCTARPSWSPPCARPSSSSPTCSGPVPAGDRGRAARCPTPTSRARRRPAGEARPAVRRAGRGRVRACYEPEGHLLRHDRHPAARRADGLAFCRVAARALRRGRRPVLGLLRRQGGGPQRWCASPSASATR